MSDDVLYAVTFIIIGIIALYLYLLPSIVAFKKDNPYKSIIVIVNLFFAWTFLVWVILLIYVYFPKNKTILDPIIDPSGTLSSKKDNNKLYRFNSHSDKAETLKELYQLKQAGAITDKEFKEKRKKLNL